MNSKISSHVVLEKKWGKLSSSRRIGYTPDETGCKEPQTAIMPIYCWDSDDLPSKQIVI